MQSICICKCVVFQLILLFLLQMCKPLKANYIIPQNAVLTDVQANYHAYENAWSIQFSNMNDVNFNVLIVEVCALAQNKSMCPTDVPQISSIISCVDLLDLLRQDNWYNTYIHSNKFKILTESFCHEIHNTPSLVQNGVDTVLSGTTNEINNPLVFLRQPMTLIIKNQNELLQRWVIPHRQLGEEVLQFTLQLRLTQLLSLQHNFIVHQSISSIQIAQPIKSLMTFTVQNPCTSVGYRAPDNAAVSLLHTSREKRCIWQCREDMFRVPYNSIPPTQDQLNVSTSEYSLLPIKYSCLKPASNVIVFTFGFVLESYMITSSYGYNQDFFNALDSLASGVKTDIPFSSILLAIPNTVYHQQTFKNIIQEKLQISCLLNQCDNIWLPSEDGWTNNNYLYAASGRRLLRTLDIHSIVIDGMLLSEDLRLLSDATYRSQLVEQLRSSLMRQVSLIGGHYTNLQISGLADIDVERIVAFVHPNSLQTTNVQDLDAKHKKQYENTSTQNSMTTLFILASTMISFVVLLLCVMQIHDRYHRRHFQAVNSA